MSATRTANLATFRTPLKPRMLYEFIRALCYLVFAPIYSYRAFGMRNMPDHGPVLLVCNHQSFLDPLLVGMCVAHRPMFSLARKSLFNNPWFGYMIRTLLAIPVDRGHSDLKAMRSCIERLQLGAPILLFPEGTRTDTGHVQPFKTGIMLLVRRARPRVIPIALDGPFDIWPKGQKLPRLCGRIRVNIGKPIDPDTLLAMPDDNAACEYLQQQVIALQQAMR